MTNRIDEIRARVARANFERPIQCEMSDFERDARADIPWLISEVDRLTAENADLQDQIKEMIHRDNREWAADQESIAILTAEVDRLTALSDQLSVKLQEYIEKVDRWVDLHSEEEIKNRTLTAERDRMREALKPFILVLENDIGASEHDDEAFRPMQLYTNKAPLLRIGHFRAARQAIGDSRPSDETIKASDVLEYRP